MFLCKVKRKYYQRGNDRMIDIYNIYEKYHKYYDIIDFG